MAEAWGPLPAPPSWTKLTDLASERLGGQVLEVSDEFFAAASWLLKPARGNFTKGNFSEKGQIFEGWETRRHNKAHDWVLIRLGVGGILRGVDIDTNWFTGNYSPEASFEAAYIPGDPSGKTILSDSSIQWTELVPRSKLRPGVPDQGHNWFDIRSEKIWTHVRLRAYPDGGIARLRVHGEARPDWSIYAPDEVVNLLALELGARVVSVSDSYFSPPDNMLLPSKGVNMGDGWETKRRRGPGHDWCIIRLAAPGLLRRLLVDTNWFKGNFPDSVSVEAVNLGTTDFSSSDEQTELSKLKNAKWVEILPSTPLGPHKEHIFVKQLKNVAGAPYTHLRLNMAPDGGISRFRAFAVRSNPLSGSKL